MKTSIARPSATSNTNSRLSCLSCNPPLTIMDVLGQQHWWCLEHSHQRSQKIQYLIFKKSTLSILTTHFITYSTSKVLSFFYHFIKILFLFLLFLILNHIASTTCKVTTHTHCHQPLIYFIQILMLGSRDLSIKANMTLSSSSFAYKI